MEAAYGLRISPKYMALILRSDSVSQNQDIPGHQGVRVRLFVVGGLSRSEETTLRAGGAIRPDA